MNLERFIHASEKRDETPVPFERWMHNVFLSDPARYSRSATKYLYDALMYYGTDESGLPKRITSEIFGVDHKVAEFMKILRAAAEGHDVGRRIMLFVGPVGTAKSTLVNILKRTLEAYSRTEQGAVYAIADCPIHETPLHLIPEHMRNDFKQEFGVTIEGQLCPVCLYNLDTKYGSDIASVPVKRIYFDEARRVGIATFVPGDYNSQDASVLVGSENLKAFQEYGDYSHPLGWNFNGSLFVANRGLHEFVEIHKAKPDLLYPLLVVAQEKQVKVDRFGMISVDEVLIAHTNYAEYDRFIAKKENEAFRDRTREIQWPYNLSVDSEVRIYQKMLQGNTSQTHLAPWTLKFIAGVAILSRLEKRPPNARYTPIELLKLYNHEFNDKLTEKDLEEARLDGDGKAGISPRIAVDAISFAAAGKTCIGPYDAAVELLEIARSHPEVPVEQIEAHIEVYRQEYHKHLKSMVFEAFIGASFRKDAQAYFDKYIEHAYAYVEDKKVKDPFTGKYVDFDEGFLRSIEEIVGITKEQARDFRTKLLLKVGTLRMEGKALSYDVNPKIKEAIERKVMEDKANFIRGAIASYVRSEEQLKATQEAKEYLVQHYGFCMECANDAINLVAYLLDTGN